MQAMFADLTHPSHEQLRSFVTNRLDQVDMALIRNHLRICVECQGFLQRFNSDGDPVSDTYNSVTDTVNTSTKPMIALDERAALTDLPLVLANHPRFNIISLLGTGAWERFTGPWISTQDNSLRLRYYKPLTHKASCDLSEK